MLGFEGLESSHILNGDNYLLAVLVVIFMFAPFMLHHTVNVDFIRFKYVVLAKYLHMSIFEFYLLIKQHSLILCKNLLWLLF
jgi:hypothetical protein